MSQFRLIVPGGLNTDIIGLGVDHLLSTGELTLGGKYPGIALIPVDKNGKNQIYVLPGINADFSSDDLDKANKLLDKRIHYILITHGAKGGYLFGKELNVHIPVPPIKKSGKVDETGCGDQVTAILAACLSKILDIIQSAKLAILAGTMQYYREGIQPVNERELLKSVEIE